MLTILGHLPELLLSLLAGAAVVWGALGRRRARREGEVAAAQKITRKIVEADNDTRQDIQKAMESHPADHSAALDRLRKRLE